MLTATDPLMHAATLTYDSLNNLLTVTDADSNVTELRYEAPMIDPTVPTSIILPAISAEPEAERTITLDYYDSTEEPDAVGQLEMVTDTNGVETLFTYDQDGQLEFEIEGDVSEPAGRYKVFTKTTYDQGSRLRGATRYGKITAGGGMAHWDGKKGALRTIATHGCNGTYTWNACSNPVAAQCCALPVNAGPSATCGSYGMLSGGLTMTYDPMDKLLTADATLSDDYTFENSIREVINTYDELGRLRTTLLDTTEPTWDTTEPDVHVLRDFAYTPNWATGTYDRTGPDGLNTHIDTDLVGRTTHVERNTSSGMITADITYYDNHQVNSVTHGNGTRMKYTYFDNTTLKQILHETTGSVLILQMDYTYNDRDLITSISETDSANTTTVSFTYDSRGRLLTESRVGLSHPYDLSYTYDQGGNRLTKTDNSADIRTDYHHDLEDPGTYRTKNNRLMYYKVFDANENLLERVDYEYELDDRPWVGNVTKITRGDILGDSKSYITCLTYMRNGELWIVTEKTFEDPAEQTVSITEFRGGGRGRYLTRQRDPADPTQVLAGTTTWYDYDGDEIYGDYEVDMVGQPTQNGVTQTGIGQVDYIGSGLSYFHGDHIGSTRLLTDLPHTIEDSYVYTAFGEKIHDDGTIGTRYRYAGAWGYQNDSEFAAPNSAFDGMHVGHRYYSPSIGRFLQRDPIGLRGGPNVYEYVWSMPNFAVDPLGLYNWWSALKAGAAGVVATVVAVILAPATAVAVGGTVVTVCGAGIAGLERKDFEHIGRRWEAADLSNPNDPIHGVDRPGTGAW
ncbi:MAG: RHS repeat-associated core domain-containing protein [Planctomycetota bacterium]|nr:RHS repeat-associated core domain-containing protein [Planctomycetota bacterium]